MLVFPLVRGPKVEGSGSTAFKNCRGMISLPSKRIGSMEVDVYKRQVLHDRPGVLMALISAFYDAGANILTVNQNIPVLGAALV